LFRRLFSCLTNIDRFFIIAKPILKRMTQMITICPSFVLENDENATRTKTVKTHRYLCFLIQGDVQYIRCEHRLGELAQV